MMMTDSQRMLARTNGTLIGRVLLGLLFLVSGLSILFGEGGVSGFSGMIAGLGLPVAGLLAWIVVATKVLGGAALILGYRVGLAAAALIVFTLLTVILVHNNAAELTNALKNLAIVGGLLYVLAYGAGEGWKM